MSEENRYNSNHLKKVLFEKLESGTILQTPSGVDFEVERVEKDRLILRIGRKKNLLYLKLTCIDEIIADFNKKSADPWMRIGAVHSAASPGTLDSIVQQYTGGTSAASYLAAILEYIGVAMIDRTRPHRIKLIKAIK